MIVMSGLFRSVYFAYAFNLIFFKKSHKIVFYGVVSKGDAPPMTEIYDV
jgi:hypothetical protein